jgi:hypothetical protein
MTGTLTRSGVTLGPATPYDSITCMREGINLQNLPQAFEAILGMTLLPALRGNQVLVQALEQTPIGGTVAWASGTFASLDPSGNPVVQNVVNTLNPAKWSL